MLTPSSWTCTWQAIFPSGNPIPGGLGPGRYFVAIGYLREHLQMISVQLWMFTDCHVSRTSTYCHHTGSHLNHPKPSSLTWPGEEVARSPRLAQLGEFMTPKRGIIFQSHFLEFKASSEFCDWNVGLVGLQ